MVGAVLLSAVLLSPWRAPAERPSHSYLGKKNTYENIPWCFLKKFCGKRCPFAEASLRRAAKKGGEWEFERRDTGWTQALESPPSHFLKLGHQKKSPLKGSLGGGGGTQKTKLTHAVAPLMYSPPPSNTVRACCECVRIMYTQMIIFQ